MRDELNVSAEELFAALSARLREKHSIVTRIMPVDVMRETLRRFDRHRRQLLISELVDGSGPRLPARAADRPGRMQRCSSMPSSTAQARSTTPPRRLYRITLANYFAAAVMTPYQPFHSAAVALNYDVHVLAQRFNAGFEQVCHRLTTLQWPNARGVPFFLLRVDNAGNVSKRFSSGTFPFSKFGGTCPLWNVHSTFDTPDRLLSQVIRTADGTRYFSIAQMVRRPIAPAPATAAALRSVWAAKSTMRQSSSTPRGWTWRRRKAHRSASTAASANAKTAASGRGADYADA